MQEEKITIPELLKKHLSNSIANQALLVSAYGEQLHMLSHMLLHFLETLNNTKFGTDEVDGVVVAIFQAGYDAAEKQQRVFKDCDFKTPEEEHETLANMEMSAGGFVKQLGIAYQTADPFNKRKLRYSFWNYFAKYLPDDKGEIPL